MLRVAAKQANGTNFAWNLTPTEFKHKLTVLRSYCEELGTDFTRIVKSLSAGVLIAEDDDTLTVVKEKLMKSYNGLEGYLPYSLRRSGLVGTPRQCAEKLKEFVKAGAQYFMLVFADIDQMRFFAKEVLPHFR